jgi:tetratricopeptide (TPR) repeat protein
MMTRTVSRALLLLALVLAGCATAAPAPPLTPRPAARPAAPEPGAPAVSTPLEHGQALIARGEMAAAATALREALRQEPDSIAARGALGAALYGLGDLDAAVEELRATLRRQPDAVDARLVLAKALVARQEWPAARDELERVLATQPDRLDAWYALGAVRYAAADINGAIEAYQRVVAADPRQHDARYNLALMLGLARREAESTSELVTAARGGHARAQYFTGGAYATGVGVERNLATAIAWWFQAAEQGVPQAEDALAQLRQAALGRGRRPAERQAAEQAFADYRAALWKDFPDLGAGGEDTVGGALLRQGRVREAVPLLIREAAALSQPAQRLLEALYEQGIEGQLPAHDARILAYLRGAAAEGLRPPPR